MSDVAQFGAPACALVALIAGVASERAEGSGARRRLRIAIGAVLLMNLLLLYTLLID